MYADLQLGIMNGKAFGKYITHINRNRYIFLQLFFLNCNIESLVIEMRYDVDVNRTERNASTKKSHGDDHFIDIFENFIIH